MIFESKRLLELAGISSGDDSNLLTEGVEDVHEFQNNDGVTEDEDNMDEADKKEEAETCEDDEAKIRETIRSEIESMWSSGQVFGNRTKSRKGQVTMGFMGVGFKK